MAAAICMNSDALAIVLMPSFVILVPNLAWGSDDNKKYADVFDDVHYAWNNSRHHPLTTRPLIRRSSHPFSDLIQIATPSMRARRSSWNNARVELAALTVVGVDEEGWPASSRSCPPPLRPRRLTSPCPRESLVFCVLRHCSRHPRGTTNDPNANGTGTRDRDAAHETGTKNSKRPLLPPGRHNTTFYNPFPNSPNESWVSVLQLLLLVLVRRLAPEVWVRRMGRRVVVKMRKGMGMKLNASSMGSRASKMAHTLAHVLVLPMHPPHSQSSSPPSVPSTYILPLLRTLLLSVHAFLTVPFYAALLSLIVALTPSLQYALEHNNSASRPVN
ncbi:hypothetical protein CVT25_006088 [Psilocybe cyanescens]|uniref:Uncharacterized protein n=1 Tax=Psilocybe cyanescens TaxID=93625 RepID=A0A409XA54_PSICY|nr:hypothetical protein CVT25_006088 [Psilocybe cyanescens]